MSVILPPQLAYLPGLAPNPQGERLRGGSAESQAQPAQPGRAAEGKPGTKADPQPQQPQPQSPCGDYRMLLLLGGFLVLMWFMMIRPQQKQEKARKQMLASLKKNDKVVTTSGIHGTVTALGEQTVTLKLDDKGEMRVKFERSAIGRILEREQG